MNSHTVDGLFSKVISQVCLNPESPSVDVRDPIDLDLTIQAAKKEKLFPTLVHVASNIDWGTAGRHALDEQRRLTEGLRSVTEMLPVRAVLMKGAAVAQYYPAAIRGLRVGTDVDLLVGDAKALYEIGAAARSRGYNSRTVSMFCSSSGREMAYGTHFFSPSEPDGTPVRGIEVHIGGMAVGSASVVPLDALRTVPGSAFGPHVDVLTRTDQLCLMLADYEFDKLFKLRNVLDVHFVSAGDEVDQDFVCDFVKRFSLSMGIKKLREYFSRVPDVPLPAFLKRLDFVNAKPKLIGTINHFWRCDAQGLTTGGTANGRLLGVFRQWTLGVRASRRYRRLLRLIEVRALTHRLYRAGVPVCFLPISTKGSPNPEWKRGRRGLIFSCDLGSFLVTQHCMVNNAEAYAAFQELASSKSI